MFTCENPPSDIKYDWKDVSLEAVISLEAISMISADVGYVGGRSNASIMKVSTQLGNGNFGDTLIYQPENGWFYQEYELEDTSNIKPILYNTNDGGNSWKPITTPFKLGITDMQFITKDVGYVVTEKEGVYKTSDGGQTWTKLLGNIMHYYYGLTSTNPFHAVSFIDEKKGFVYGDESTGNVLFSTSDGGKSWNCISYNYPSGITGKYLTLFTDLEKLMFFSSSDTGYVVDNSVLFKTSDMGKNWDIIHNLESENASKVFFINPSTGYIIDLHLVTKDGGKTWSSNNDIDFYGDNIILLEEKEFFYLSNGSILKKNIGHSESQLMTLEKDNFIKKLVFPSNNVGYAIGKESTILKYERK